MNHGYERSLLFVLRHRFSTLMLAFGLLGASVWLFIGMPKGFLPSVDSGIHQRHGAGRPGHLLRLHGRHVTAVKNIMQHDPNDDSVFAFVNGGNSGNVFMMLKPRKDRALSADQVIQELQPKLLAIPGIQAFLQNPPPIQIGGNNTQSPYQLTLQDADQNEIYHWVPILQDKMRTLPGFMNVTSDLQIASPQINVDIDRDRAETFGVTPDQIQNALFTAYGTRQASTIYTPSNEYQVILEVEPQYQRNPDALSKLYVRSAKGSLVPLDSVVKLKRSVGPLSVNHFGQLPAATISFNLVPGFALGDAAARIDEVIRDLRMPPTLAPLYQGTVQAFQQSFKGLSILLIVAILVIYMVLGMLYESFIHPITILSGLPSAVFGALLTLKIFHKDLDLYAFVGLIMLFGVVKKNAIMMIDFAIEAQRDGRQKRVRRHPCRLHSALPAHHDDDGRGAVRHAADRAGHRRRRRRASTARPRRGGRAAVLAVHHALHHAGDLSVSGRRGAARGPHPDLAPRDAGNTVGGPGCAVSGLYWLA